MADLPENQVRPDPDVRTARDSEYDDRLTGGVNDVLRGVVERDEERVGRDPRTTEEWQQMIQEVPGGLDVHGGSNGSGREEKMGSPVCEECHLEFCTCVGGDGVKQKRGRRKRIDVDGIHGRSSPIAFRVSEPAKEGLKTPGVAALIDELGFAIQNGLTLDNARQKLGLPEKKAAA